MTALRSWLASKSQAERDAFADIVTWLGCMGLLLVGVGRLGGWTP